MDTPINKIVLGIMLIIIALKILLLISVIIRAYLYTYIADKNNFGLGGGGGFSFYTLWFYDKPVSEEYEFLKNKINKMQWINLILLGVLILRSVIYYLLN